MTKINAWWAREDSNLQPDRYEPAALTIGLRARSRGARRQRRAILPSSMPTRRGNRAGRAMALKGATYMQSALEGTWLMPNNLLKSRQLFSRPCLNSLPCGEGLGVGVVIGGRSRAKTTTPSPTLPHKGGGSTPSVPLAVIPFRRDSL